MLKQLHPLPKASPWFYAWIVVALIYAVPVAMRGYERVMEVTHHAREQLIVQHRLWELHPEVRGNPGNWARLAARLLTDRQLMRRIQSKYGEAAHAIELEYRNDLTIAQAEVIAAALAIWALPVAILYLVAVLARRRKRPPPPPPAPARPAYDESRYRRP
ncbi:MAG: hypothetical protein HY526_09650 [Betaproteobacteria bacterium]|nr:hypothetical protein [Betaproteobacteria bacterium]